LSLYPIKIRDKIMNTNSKRTTAVIILALALWLVSEQLSLRYRFVQLQDEAYAMVEHIYKTKAQTDRGV
jgi:hypothetical protein